jgi:hypothetical protein
MPNVRANVKKMQRAKAERGKIDVGDAIFFTIISGGISGFCLHKANLLQNGSPQHVATPVFFTLGAIAGGQMVGAAMSYFKATRRWWTDAKLYATGGSGRQSVRVPVAGGVRLIGAFGLGAGMMLMGGDPMCVAGRIGLGSKSAIFSAIGGFGATMAYNVWFPIFRKVIFSSANEEKRSAILAAEKQTWEVKMSTFGVFGLIVGSCLMFCCLVWDSLLGGWQNYNLPSSGELMLGRPPMVSPLSDKVLQMVRWFSLDSRAWSPVWAGFIAGAYTQLTTVGFTAVFAETFQAIPSFLAFAWDALGFVHKIVTVAKKKKTQAVSSQLDENASILERTRAQGVREWVQIALVFGCALGALLSAYLSVTQGRVIEVNRTHALVGGGLTAISSQLCAGGFVKHVVTGNTVMFVSALYVSCAILAGAVSTSMIL